MRSLLAIKFFVSLAIIFAALPALAQVQGLETRAKYAILIDDTTNTVIYEKQPDERMTPSSMTKLMTLYVLFDKLKKGAFSIHDTFRVSEKAWRMQGSKSFMALDSHVPIEDLIRGIIIQSGNDACVVIAEGISGSEESFANEMNVYAEKLGLKGSHFMNSNGWPDPNHYMTARDLSIVAHRIINDFPEYYPYFGEKEYTYNKIRQYNRNLLLNRSMGVDGLKTGHTEEGGYGMVASALRDGRRVTVVVNGLSSEKERADEAEKLLEYGFRDFENLTFFKAGDIIDNAEVWYGKEKTVPLTTDRDIVITINKYLKKDLSVNIAYNGPLPTPIKKGDHVADLVIKREGVENIVVPLQAAADVPKLGFFGRIGRTIAYRLAGHK